MGGGYIIAFASLRWMADCLIIMSAVSLSSNSIHRIGEATDILEETIFILFSLSSLSRNSIAALFLISLNCGWFRSSLFIFNDI